MLRSFLSSNLAVKTSKRVGIVSGLCQDYGMSRLFHWPVECDKRPVGALLGIVDKPHLLFYFYILHIAAESTSFQNL